MTRLRNGNFRKGDTIMDKSLRGMVSGRIVGQGVLGKNNPVWKVAQGWHKGAKTYYIAKGSAVAMGFR